MDRPFSPSVFEKAHRSTCTVAFSFYNMHSSLESKIKEVFSVDPPFDFDLLKAERPHTVRGTDIAHA